MLVPVYCPAGTSLLPYWQQSAVLCYKSAVLLALVCCLAGTSLLSCWILSAVLLAKLCRPAGTSLMCIWHHAAVLLVPACYPAGTSVLSYWHQYDVLPATVWCPTGTSAVWCSADNSLLSCWDRLAGTIELPYGHQPYGTSVLSSRLHSSAMLAPVCCPADCWHQPAGSSLLPCWHQSAVTWHQSDVLPTPACCTVDTSLLLCSPAECRNQSYVLLTPVCCPAGTILLSCWYQSAVLALLYWHQSDDTILLTSVCLYKADVLLKLVYHPFKTTGGPMAQNHVELIWKISSSCERCLRPH